MRSIREIKARAKYGPKVSRQMRAEFVLTAVDGAPRQLSPELVDKFCIEIARLATGDRPAVQRFVAQMRHRYPDLL